MTTCAKCGQIINEVVLIDNKPYGTTCGARILGMIDFPAWFKGGDWNKAKAEHEAEYASFEAKSIAADKITDEYWNEWLQLSIAAEEARRNSNDWVFNFIRSVVSQLGYYSTLAETKWHTKDEAYNNWSAASGSLPKLWNEPRHINSLSAKQLNLLSKYCEF